MDIECSHAAAEIDDLRQPRQLDLLIIRKKCLVDVLEQFGRWPLSRRFRSISSALLFNRASPFLAP
jgi:hypothetical protein